MLDLNQLLELGVRLKMPGLNARMSREALITGLLEVHGAPGELEQPPAEPNPQVDDEPPVRRGRPRKDD
jgi:hypothetical protein